MSTEKGVIIAVYKPKKPERFAVLKRNKNWEGWELPKGHLEKDDYTETVKIELREETGIEEEQIQDIEDLEHTVTWKYEDDGEEIQKRYKGFLVKVSEDSNIDVTANPCDEHENGFFFRKRDVEKMLTYENQKEFLELAEKRIEES